MKASRSAIQERRTLRLLVGCCAVGCVCLEISDFDFDGIHLVTALGVTYSKQKLKPREK